MSTGEPERRRVLVAGDVSVNWNIARVSKTPEKGSLWRLGEKAEVDGELGGAKHLALLLAEVGKAPKGGPSTFEVSTHESWAMPKVHHASNYHHSYRVWSQFPHDERDTSTKVWRVEEFLGFNGASRAHNNGPERVALSDVDLVVIADTNLGFRIDRRRWPKGIETPSDGPGPWILLKMGAPVARGALWDKLVGNHADRLIAIVTINELRDSGVAISRELSWEKTAIDLVRVLQTRPEARPLNECAHVIVSLTTGGAILLSRRQDRKRGALPPTCRAIFDPEAIENSWVDMYQGGMAGYATCLTVAVARELILDPANPDLEKGIRRGLAASRALHVMGYHNKSKVAGGAILVFPVTQVAAKLSEETSDEFCVATIAYPAPEGWSIVGSLSEDLMPLAQLVARNGEAALKNVPFGRFGDYLTVDRGEIEGFRSIRNLIREYNAQDAPRPLSIAVFGPPGSGKSFGVKAVAKAALPAGSIVERSFNLSQFQSPSELADALHQIRDVGLRGKLPFAFWDEFDADLGSAPLGWLRYFLAPMQDGEFQVAQVPHPIGKAIFVFAGGTSASLAKFGAARTKKPDDTFRLAKGPDFVSRLKGYVDIVGPDPRGGNRDSDRCYVLRRAILLRSMLKAARPGLFDDNGSLSIDGGVLRAFLEVKEYKHGARSVESIIWMSSLSGKATYERSDLPAKDQLDAHVFADDFLGLVEQTGSD